MSNLPFKPLQFGDITIDRCVESEGDFFPAAMFFPDSTEAMIDAQRDWLEPHFMKPKSIGGGMLGGIFTYVIRTDRHTILVDTCVGNDKERTMTPNWHMKQTGWLDDLRAMGVAPESVDFVMCTHLHVDHVGWNTQLVDGRWVPTFPNARYIFHKTEYEAWEKSQDNPAMDGCFKDSVLPVVEAGNADLVTSDYAVNDAIWLEPSPGHTPGHVCINLKGGGKHALFTGDSFHHPLQVAYPEWSSAFCSDKQMSADTRHRIVDKLCDTDSYMMAAHFAAPTAGRVVANGDRCKLQVDE
jgi:glyoxylase-like metal-dependent hydrolase (beta-lactamase superfamily II)